MVDLIIEKLHDRDFMFMLFVSIAVAATVLTVGMPLLAGDNLNKRMKTVALERDKIRAREREKLARGDRSSLHSEAKPFMKRVVDELNLAKHFGTDDAREQLQMAGYRGPGPQVTFLFFRFAVPVLLVGLTLVYTLFIQKGQQSALMILTLLLIAAYTGMKLPEIFLKNQIAKRQQSIRRSWPDALDLMLICVESGMSIEAAFRKVSDEIGEQSIALAEELVLTTAEMSYLQNRRQAYENLGLRTGLESVKSVVAALIQAEKYGTPIGQAMRVLAQESRDMRMAEAEKKAAALPPKLTVPMIVFFLPVLFVVILGPAGIRVTGIM